MNSMISRPRVNASLEVECLHRDQQDCQRRICFKAFVGEKTVSASGDPNCDESAEDQNWGDPEESVKTLNRASKLP
jgi:hypothetical protein